jgi:hypothetical protein
MPAVTPADVDIYCRPGQRSDLAPTAHLGSVWKTRCSGASLGPQLP